MSDQVPSSGVASSLVAALSKLDINNPAALASLDRILFLIDSVTIGGIGSSVWGLGDGQNDIVVLGFTGKAVKLVPNANGALALIVNIDGLVEVSGATGVLLKSTGVLTNGAAAAAGTLTNAPAAGNPTKWISINDGGTIRKIPAW